VLRQWPWAAVPLAVLYLILLAVHFGAVLSATYLDADTASAPVIGQLFSTAAPHAHVVLGTFGWYSTLLFEVATRWLPLHRQIWEVAPYAMVLAATALTGWSVWRIAGAPAAALSAVLMICLAPRTLHLLLSTTEHGPVWFCAALLGAVLVLVGMDTRRLSPILLSILALVTGVVVGVNAASDQLVAIGVIAPFIVATVTSYAVTRGRPGGLRMLQFAAGTLMVAAAAWFLTDRLMIHYNVTACGCAPSNNLLAGGDQVGTNFKLWWQSVAELANGGFYGLRVSVTSLLAVACAVLALTSVALLPRLGWNEARSWIDDADVRAPVIRLAFLVYWCASAAFLTLAFVVSAAPDGLNADRYLVGLIYAAAAVIPVVAARRRLFAVAALAGTIVVGLTAVISMVQGVPYQQGLPSDAEINQVERLAAENGLSVGYSGYWDAAPITWATRLRVQVYPVAPCGPTLCRFNLHTIDSWYTPRPGVRSFLLADPSLPVAVSPTANLGPPSATYHLGPMTMYVYPYDLAGKIAP
jgi:hypothetical protein